MYTVYCTWVCDMHSGSQVHLTTDKDRAGKLAIAIILRNIYYMLQSWSPGLASGVTSTCLWVVYALYMCDTWIRHITLQLLYTYAWQWKLRCACELFTCPCPLFTHVCKHRWCVFSTVYIKGMGNAIIWGLYRPGHCLIFKHAILVDADFCEHIYLMIVPANIPKQVMWHLLATG